MILTNVLVCDKIYNMETSQNEPTPKALKYYLPEELGLDQSKKEDLELYVESKGLREAGELLLERRKLANGYILGDISPEQHDLHQRIFSETLEKVFADNGIEAPRP
jgi:hypothetical protein